MGAATIKALSPNVLFDRTAGVESKIPVLPEDLRLYKDELNVNKSHKYSVGARPWIALNAMYPRFNREPMQITQEGNLGALQIRYQFLDLESVRLFEVDAY